MTDSDRPRLAQVLALLGEMFNEPISELRAEGYFDALSDLPIDTVEGAARLALRTKTFFPKPVELRELAQGTESDNAELGWQELHAEFRRVGSWRPPTLSPTTQETMLRLCGSWERACAAIGQSMGPERLGWAKRWKDAYGTTRHQLERGELIGRGDAKQLLASLTEQLPDAHTRTLSLVPKGIPVAGDVHDEGWDDV